MILDTGIEHLHAIELPTPFPVGPITVYLADAPGDPLTLVDTGPLTSKTSAVLEADMAQLGYAFSDLERIVVSHVHVDHCGLARTLVDASGARVWTHPWNVAALGDFQADRDQRIAFYAGLLIEAAVPAEALLAVGRITKGMKDYARAVTAEEVLVEGGSLRLAGRDWQVLHTPGHASGLVCLYEPGSRTLLSSDHLLAGISSNPVVEPPPPGEAVRLRSLVVYQESLKRVAGLGVSLALPGHGPAIHDVAGLVARRTAFHKQRLGHVLDAVADGARTTWDVTQVLFPHRPPLDTFLAVSEVVGHLDVLEMEGRIVAERQDEIVSWRLAH